MNFSVTFFGDPLDLTGFLSQVALRSNPPKKNSNSSQLYLSEWFFSVKVSAVWPSKWIWLKMMTFHFEISSDRTNVQPFVATPILSPCAKFCRAKEIQILLGRKGIRMCGTFAWPLNPSVKLPVVVWSTIQTCLAKTSFCGKGVVHFSVAHSFAPTRVSYRWWFLATECQYAQMARFTESEIHRAASREGKNLIHKVAPAPMFYIIICSGQKAEFQPFQLGVSWHNQCKIGFWWCV